VYFFPSTVRLILFAFTVPAPDIVWGCPYPQWIPNITKAQNKAIMRNSFMIDDKVNYECRLMGLLPNIDTNT
jgi:hypothetical protein